LRQPHELQWHCTVQERTLEILGTQHPIHLDRVLCPHRALYSRRYSDAAEGKSYVGNSLYRGGINRAWSALNVAGSRVRVADGNLLVAVYVPELL
jgi:hypothetical protein